MINQLIEFCLKNKLVVILLTLGMILWGVLVLPFEIDVFGMPKSPIPVDAIPDIGENQQIVFTEWLGRSPQDIEDQITYPLTVNLQGIPEVKTVRSYSYFGFSTIYIIFKENVDFYWSRSRVLEKLNAISSILPTDVSPKLGPDATGLGQIFWYTLEGEDFSLQELRSIQDFYVKYAIQGVEGVSEVSSIGGFVKEYQIDVDPEKLKQYQIPVQKVYQAIKDANMDIGAKTIDINSVEYVLRGLGLIKNTKDIEEVVVEEFNNTPIKVKDLGLVTLGPAIRRGVLDKEGSEVVGGVVVSRYGANPLSVIKNIKEKIKEISSGLPKKYLSDGQLSQVKIKPFYDRSILIKETLDTLKQALTDEINITIIVILIMMMNLKISFLVSSMLPLGVLMSFILMKMFAVDSNIICLCPASLSL